VQAWNASPGRLPETFQPNEPTAEPLRPLNADPLGSRSGALTTTADSIVDHWFGDDLESPKAVSERSRQWFASDPTFDELIRSRFRTLPDQALNGDFAEWTRTPLSTLALVLILDQFPRNLYRGSPRSFAYDSAAVNISRKAVARNLDHELHPLHAVFLYLPLEHSEDQELQNQCVSLFRQLVERAPSLLTNQFSSFLEYAERHHAVIEQFGRFPHRNSILGRISTPEELEFLHSGGDTFS
jgi:uncharacterized protein (DUF924 family)